MATSKNNAKKTTATDVFTVLGKTMATLAAVGMLVLVGDMALELHRTDKKSKAYSELYNRADSLNRVMAANRGNSATERANFDRAHSEFATVKQQADSIKRDIRNSTCMLERVLDRMNETIR